MLCMSVKWLFILKGNERAQRRQHLITFRNMCDIIIADQYGNQVSCQYEADTQKFL